MSVRKLRSVDELVYVLLLTTLDEHPRALELLSLPTHSILMKIETETYFVLYSVRGFILILQVDDPQTYNVTWENDVAVGTEAIESALEFFRDLHKNHPEELTEDHIDFVLSLRLLQDAHVAALKENRPKHKRIKPLFGPRTEYLH